MFSPQSVGAPQKEKNPGALDTCPACPLVKTALTNRDREPRKIAEVTEAPFGRQSRVSQLDGGAYLRQLVNTMD